MPNLSRNRLTVTGPAVELDRFLAAAKRIDSNGQEDAFSLRSLFPIPAHLDTNLPVEDCNMESWYTWCIEHWGIKWDVRVKAAARRSTEEFQVRFTSAWDTAEKAFSRRIAPNFPALTFHLRTREEDGSKVYVYRWSAGMLEVRRAKRLFWGLGVWRAF